jgi:hypothetical protein
MCIDCYRHLLANEDAHVKIPLTEKAPYKLRPRVSALNARPSSSRTRELPPLWWAALRHIHPEQSRLRFRPRAPTCPALDRRALTGRACLASDAYETPQAFYIRCFASILSPLRQFPLLAARRDARPRGGGDEPRLDAIVCPLQKARPSGARMNLFLAPSQPSPLGQAHVGADEHRGWTASATPVRSATDARQATLAGRGIGRSIRR